MRRVLMLVPLALALAVVPAFANVITPNVEQSIEKNKATTYTMKVSGMT